MSCAGARLDQPVFFTWVFLNPLDQPGFFGGILKIPGKPGKRNRISLGVHRNQEAFSNLEMAPQAIFFLVILILCEILCLKMRSLDENN